MPRPIKWRRIENLPEYEYFAPINVANCELEENILKVEELEAIRLKDLEGLDQEACAKRMEVSRQTFQRIYNEAKMKIADSLVNGKAIRIKGGNYTQNICVFACKECGTRWENRVEDVHENEIMCPECGSKNIYCDNKPKRSFCQNRCRGRGRGLRRHRRCEINNE